MTNSNVAEFEGNINAQWSISGEQSIDQLVHARGETVGIERVGGKPISAMPGEHQLFVDRAAMNDLLQGLLNTEASRVGLASGVVAFVLRPIAEVARA